MSQRGPVFNDPVHGCIELDPLLVKIIHTPQFQRLKDIKQLGATYWVYPGASHNRFEHCLGTAYLAGRMIEALRDIHKNEYRITEEEVLCVKVAALCHDLGHGPFSHVFDTQIKTKLTELHPENNELQTWKHEDASCDLFDYMLRENTELNDAFNQRNIKESERRLVKELIKGKKPGENIQQKETIDGVDYAKWFLFEIVANKRNGIDCDKFDYFARDCLNLGVKSNFDHNRYLQNIRILRVGKKLQICVRDKLVFDIYELFHTRWSLHHRVYKHKTVKGIEEMISEAFKLVDHKFNFSGAISKMEIYSRLTDSIFYEIILCKDDDEKVKKAQELLKRIQRRDLYKFCGQTRPTEKLECKASEVSEEIASFGDLNPNDIFVSFVEADFGMKDQDPVNSVVFFSKDLKVIRLRTNAVSEMLPKTFAEQYVRVYSKTSKLKNPNSGEEKELVESFKKWCVRKNFTSPDEAAGDKTGYFTVYQSDENEAKHLKE